MLWNNSRATSDICDKAGWSLGAMIMTGSPL